MGQKPSNFCVDTDNFSKARLFHNDEQLHYAVVHMKGKE
jgi:hypothetical protein